MRVKFSSNGKLRQVIGAAQIRLEVPEGSKVADVLETVASQYGPEARNLMMGERSGVLVLLEDEMIEETTLPVNEGDEVTVMLPMAGG
jgi:molybdopterin converting factor small subunit